MLCIHCKNAKVSRPRNLCWKCYYTDDVREQYPIMDVPQNNRGACGKDFNKILPHAPPTKALPGTEDKISVMEKRAAEGRPIFSPEDAKVEPDWF